MESDFLIIGGGVAGLSSALEFARTGASVSVVERGQCGAESSWAGGGILFPLLPWDYSPAVTDLTQLSCQLFPEWTERIADMSGVDPEYRVSGMRVMPPFDGERAMQWCAGHGVRLEQDGETLWLPDVAQVRNPRLIKALRLALERIGVRIVERVEVTGIVSTEDRVARLDTTAGPFAAERYVVAAGAWSKKLLGKLGVQLDIKPVRGQMLLYKAQPGMLRHIIVQNGAYLIPRDDGHILVGSTLEDVGFDKATTEEAKVALHARALGMLPQLAQAEFVKHWAGLRPAAPDNIPTIARHPQLDNLFLNSGHFRYGVTMAPASAQILVNHLLNQEQPIDVSSYDWPRLN
ncbi:N-acetylglucosamine-1-phosphate uridyltransferase [Sulfuricella sp. T08]|uniref:glycine oxidase ThiO n=1 Tax=Sulfuricella sp. T08 TaxID=1632857 RepID=UPI0006179C07|nr:glycine oxidase ThiO [Sulfuricella sp. T08]GAO37776.1 N-acetylglucosamine-1-phosphate uridyltransferase [Sulfuricella sp. T08]